MSNSPSQPSGRSSSGVGFTPGPWFARGRSVEAANDPICEVGRSKDRARDEADARLIASAPELYACGERLLARLDRFVAEVAEPLFTEEREALRAALSKVCGDV